MARRDYTRPTTIDMGVTGDKPQTQKSTEKKKLFISLPMNGRSEADVLNDIKTISEKFKDNFEIINSYQQEEDPNGIDRYSGVWYLGNSIKLMRTANLVCFAKNWASARGCIIEHRICELYDIPFIELI